MTDSDRLGLGLRGATGLAGLAIAWVTLCPPAMRPSLGPPDLERFLAFVGMGALGAAAFPTRRMSVLFALVAFAVALEFGQALIPGRDPRVSDALIKAAGAVTGILTVLGLARKGLRQLGRRPHRLADGDT